MEDVAGKTFGVHSNEHALIRVTDISKHESDVLVSIYVVSVTDHPPHTVVCRQSGFCDPMNKSLRTQAVCNELCDCDKRELVLPRKLLKLRPFRSRAVIIQNFADDAGRINAGESRKIDRCFGVTDALKN